MPVMHQRMFRARHIHTALLSFIFLVSLCLSAFLTAPAQAAGATSPPPSPAGPSDPRELETFLDSVIGNQMLQDHIAGASVSVVKDGRLLFAKGYGSADLQNDTPVSAQTTLFRVGSLSKLFTTVAVLQLVEQGKLDLHADVNTYLTTFRIPATYPQPITLAHLLTHTAGFEDRESGLYPRTPGDLEPLGRWLGEHLPARGHPPGVMTAYSNYGFALAGYIVEQVSGLPFEQYIEQHLFQPLGMSESTFRQPLPAKLSAALSQGYTFGHWEYQPAPFDVVQMMPAGALSSTATDMAQFMLALLQNGQLTHQRILQASSAQAMQTQQFTNDPRVSGMAYGFPMEDLNGQRLLVHTGAIPPAFCALLALLPGQHVGLFVSYNSAGGLLALSPLLQAFLDHYYPSPATQTTLPTPPTGFAERLGQISGTYWSTRRSDTSFEKLFVPFASAVSVSDAGSGRVVIGNATYAEVAPWVFRQVDGPETVVFRADAGGTLMLRGNDPTEAFTRAAWYDTPTLHLGLVLACELLFLSALLVPVLGLVRRARRRGTYSKTSGGKAERAGVQTLPPAEMRKPPISHGGMLPRLASWLAGVLCVLNILVLIGVVLFLLQQGSASKPDFLFGVPPLLTAVFILALISAFLTAGSIAGSLLAWWGRFWSVGRRIHYTLVALAALAFVGELLYWNLLGFRA